MSDEETGENGEATLHEEDVPEPDEADSPSSPPQPPPKPAQAEANGEAAPGDLAGESTSTQPSNFSSGKPSRLAKEKLMESEGIIPIQAGTNKFDSQKGITGFGRPRDVLDHSKCTVLKELDEKHAGMCKEIIRLQSGSNKFASQKGQSAFGIGRDVNYHMVGSTTMQELPEEKVRISEGIVRLQSGTNKLASQTGQTAFGAVRGVKPSRFDNPEQSPDSQGFVPLQMGTNKFASQKGQTGFGMPRNTQTKITDEGRGEIPNDESILPKQNIGCSRGASQRGMSGFGAFRNTTVQGLRSQDRHSQGFVPYQMGINWMDSQAGKTPFGQPRLTTTPYVDDTRPELPEDIILDPHTPKWTRGSFGAANQVGMTAMGMPRDVKGQYLRRLW